MRSRQRFRTRRMTATKSLRPPDDQELLSMAVLTYLEWHHITVSAAIHSHNRRTENWSALLRPLPILIHLGRVQCVTIDSRRPSQRPETQVLQ